MLLTGKGLQVLNSAFQLLTQPKSFVDAAGVGIDGAEQLPVFLQWVVVPVGVGRLRLLHHRQDHGPADLAAEMEVVQVNILAFEVRCAADLGQREDSTLEIGQKGRRLSGSWCWRGGRLLFLRLALWHFP